MQRGPFKNAPRPDLILLDLNLPRKNGRGGPIRDQGRSRTSGRFRSSS